MKKTLSVILAIVMILTCFVAAVAAVPADHAAICGHCGSCTAKAGTCAECIYCPNLEKGRICSCVGEYDEATGEYSFCCANCTGLWPCECGRDCGCEYCLGQSQEIDDGTGDPIIPPKTQEQIIANFQKIIRQIADALDKFFDAIFEFLRLDEVIGR